MCNIFLNYYAGTGNTLSTTKLVMFFYPYDPSNLVKYYLDLGNTVEDSLNLPVDQELCEEEREKVVGDAVEAMLESFRLTPDLQDREYFENGPFHTFFLKYVPDQVKGNLQRDK